MPEGEETWPFGANRQERVRIVANAVLVAEFAYSTASTAMRDLASCATLTKIALDVWTEKNKATLNRATADLATEQELDEAASGPVSYTHLTLPTNREV